MRLIYEKKKQLAFIFDTAPYGPENMV